MIKYLANIFGKIWLFWQNEWEGSVVQDSTQQITIKFCIFGKTFLVTSVYARCTILERLELWKELENMDASNFPWLVGGDFNVILHKEEKLGGLEFTQHEAMNFAQCINNYALSEMPFYWKYLHLVEWQDK